MFFKKKEKSSDVSIDLSLLKYCSGQQFYVGADQVYLVCTALQMALQYADAVKFIKPKEYKKIEPLALAWSDLLAKNESWLHQLEALNRLS